MGFNEESFGQVIVFHLAGKIMGGPETREIRERLKALIESGAQHLVMDFQDVQWINSTGVGVIISSLVTLRKRDGDVRFANVKGTTLHYFHVMKLERMMNIYESVDEAVRSFTLS